MKKLKFVVALIFTSFCFFASAESVSTDLVMEKISQNINASMNTPEITETKEIKTIDILLEYQNIGFSDFGSNIDIIVNYHSSTRLKSDKLFADISDHPFYRLTSGYWILSDQLNNSVGKYKPHISYQF